MPPLLGLRVDVDTHEGLRDGVPRLLELLRTAGARASFFVAMGPDRSGLALLNLLRPGFLAKMRRTGAARLYGPRTLLSGTLLPSRPIGSALPGVLHGIRDAGHELGVHAWDHRAWQDRVLRWPASRVTQQLDRAFRAFERAVGEPATTCAAPAWLTVDAALLHQERHGLLYASDCRGDAPFLPSLADRVLATPQVPATLPTLDEALGDRHRSAEAYFAAVLDEASAMPYPVLTVHAELEGGPHAGAFARFLAACAEGGLRTVPLRDVLAARLAEGPLEPCRIELATVRGRHGRVSAQRTVASASPLRSRSPRGA